MWVLATRPDAKVYEQWHKPNGLRTHGFVNGASLTVDTCLWVNLLQFEFEMTMRFLVCLSLDCACGW